MISHNTNPQLEVLREKDVIVEVTDANGGAGKLYRCGLLTALNRLVADGFDRWLSRVSLNSGQGLTTTHGLRFEVIPEHQGRPWQPSPVFEPAAVPLAADDVLSAYQALASELSPSQKVQLDELLGRLVSKVRNQAQVLVLRGEAWANEALETEDAGDAERSGFFAGLAAYAAYVGAELVVALGREISPRSAAIRPFDFPEAWQVDPPQSEDLKPLSSSEQRDEDGMSAAKHEGEA